MALCRDAGLARSDAGWDLALVLNQTLETRWKEPDEGIWEVRGGARHFTHSKMMAWVAFDRSVRAVESHGLPGPVDRWRAIRDEIHAEVCSRGFDPALNAFVQSYGSKALDASLLMMPYCGFLPADDPRVVGTVAAVERDLVRDRLVMRYSDAGNLDGLPAGEGMFLACSFWLVDNLALQGRLDEAVDLFDFLLSLRNDVGLLAEEYDTDAGRMLGNFPQALSHIALVNSAYALAEATSRT
jgi:GH15 family glucan-1,4-alpha-glucosidase